MLTERVDDQLLHAAPHLEVIANYAVGFDNIDLAATTARGIPVGVTPDVLTDATADLTFALLLAAARRLVPAAASVRRRPLAHVRDPGLARRRRHRPDDRDRRRRRPHRHRGRPARGTGLRHGRSSPSAATTTSTKPYNKLTSSRSTRRSPPTPVT